MEYETLSEEDVEATKRRAEENDAQVVASLEREHAELTHRKVGDHSARLAEIEAHLDGVRG